jgi:ABC-type Zn uptake system ZnuABC Zn-binding protein ZnuA
MKVWLDRAAMWILLTALLAGSAMGCAPDETHAPDDGDLHEHEHDGPAEVLGLPELKAVELEGGPLRVVATTSIIGDVAAQVGGEGIALTTLMGPGQDPHSYEPAARDLTAVAGAHVILINGWDLEQGLAGDLAQIGRHVPVVPVSAHITPLAWGEGEEEPGGQEHKEEDAEHAHGAADPHVWHSVHNVEQWVENLARVFGDLDPARAEAYAANATAYRAELEALAAYAETALGQIPEERRFLVTNHDALGYFAHEYGLTVLGTVIPSASTLAEPSVSDLAALIEEMEAHRVCALFTETTVSDLLVQTVAAELDGCPEVRVEALYTGAVGPPGSGAESYIGMYRANVDAVVAGLR